MRVQLAQAAFVPLSGLLLAFLVVGAPAPPVPQPLDNPIKHVVVIMRENHSFDNYFGTFPGVNGISNDPPQAGAKTFITSSMRHDLCHSANCSRAYYDGGKMDGWTDPQAYGTHNAGSIPYYWQLAKNYTLFDNYFSGFMGPSLPNHIVAIAGWNYKDTENQLAYNGLRLNLTIFDELNARNLTWSYYTGYCCYLNGFNPLPLATHDLKARDISSFSNDVASRPLPSVTYVLPVTDELSEHPPYNVTQGMMEVQRVITAVQHSSVWNSTAVLLTWDEGGGFYDHLAPLNDTFGFRVPMILVSPFARHGFVDHTFASHSSIPAFIEAVFRLPCMYVDCHSYDLMGGLDLGSTQHPLLSLVHAPGMATTTFLGSPGSIALVSAARLLSSSPPDSARLGNSPADRAESR